VKIIEIKNFETSFLYTGHLEKRINFKNVKMGVTKKLSTLATSKIKNYKNFLKTYPIIHPITGVD